MVFLPNPTLIVDDFRDNTNLESRASHRNLTLGHAAHIVLARPCFTTRPLSPSHLSPCALIGERPLSGVVCLVRANTLASSHPSSSSYCHAGLVSCQHILDEDRIYAL